MIDGIAGSGKSTIAKAAIEWARSTGYRVFDLKEWSETHTEPPRFEDVSDYDLFVTFEPTRLWVGSAIRHELSQTEKPYSGKALAHAFALDREIQYKRLIVPALAAGKHVIQDRGVTTSIVYQPIMPDSPSLEELLELPGNTFALEHAPDHLIVTDIEAELAVKRLPGRKEESKGVFAELDMLKKWNERFRSDWFRELFEKKGSQVHYLDTRTEKDLMLQQATELIKRLFTQT